MKEVAPREISISDGFIWLGNLVVAMCKVSSDVLLIKSILKNIQLSADCVSLLGDNRMLLTFSSQELRDSFLNMQDSLQDCFSSLKAWDENVVVSKRFLWINVFGIPLKY